MESPFEIISVRVFCPRAKIGHPSLVRNCKYDPFCHFWSTLSKIFSMMQQLSWLLKVVFRWSKDLLRRPNNQNSQIPKLIFSPKWSLSSPFEKFWSIVEKYYCILKQSRNSFHFEPSCIEWQNSALI